MKLTTKIVLSFLLAIVIIALIGYVNRHNSETVNSAQRWVEHTHIVIENLQELETFITGATAGVRGYVITGDEKFAQTIPDADEKCRLKIAEIKILTADNALQQARIGKLESLILSQIKFLEEVRAARKANGYEAARSLVALNGLTNIVPIHKITAQMEADERSLLEQRNAQVNSDVTESLNWIIFGSLAGSILIGTVAFFMTASIRSSISLLLKGMESIGKTSGEAVHIEINTRDEFNKLARGFNLMSDRLRDLASKERDVDWIKSNLNDFAHVMQGHTNLERASETILSRLADSIGAQSAVIYGAKPSVEGPMLVLLSEYGTVNRAPETLAFGETLVGQCAKDQKALLLTGNDVKERKVGTALNQMQPRTVTILPLVYEGETKAVLEIASLKAITENEYEFLKRLSTWLGVVFNSIEATQLTDKLLNDSQVMNEELTAQQEELRHLNEELEQKAEELDIQNQSVAAANLELEEAQRSVEETVAKLASASKYKSEFLANMSHDLRTPLNSLLILSGLLAENHQGNLQPDQVDFAKSISSSGRTLLALVDNILDLSKIEAGVVKWDLAETKLSDLLQYINITFAHMAEERKIKFETEIANGVPEFIVTDERRLQQILTNLLSNAFKFTENGTVKLLISCVERVSNNVIPVVVQRQLKIDVVDSGIGIADSSQQLIFEAFQQADGSAKRKYGGTGLGLTICRQIARGLGGDVTVESTLGQGSTFSVLLPLSSRGLRKRVLAVGEDEQQTADISRLIESNEVEVSLARSANEAERLLDELDFNCIVLDPQEKSEPSSSLHLMDDLREKARMRNLPIIVYTEQNISREQETRLRKTCQAIILKGTGSEERLQHELSVLLKRADGGTSQKPTEPQKKDTLSGSLSGRRVLIVDDDARNIFALTHLLERHEIDVSHAESGKDAIEVLLRDKGIELVLMDIMMPDMDGCEAIGILRTKDELKGLPILAVTAKAMKGDRQKCLDAGASDYITKPVDTDQLISLLRVWLRRK